MWTTLLWVVQNQVSVTRHAGRAEEPRAGKGQRPRHGDKQLPLHLFASRKDGAASKGRVLYPPRCLTACCA
jgi:hypothetical protein